MLDKKATLVLNSILKNKETDINRIERETKLTLRQIDYSLNKINELLVDYKLMPLRMNSTLIRLTTAQFSFLRQYPSSSDYLTSYILDSEERRYFIFLILVSQYSDYIAVNDFIDLLKISKTTLMNDLKQLEHELLNYRINLLYSRKDGYYLSGEEFDIRRFLIRQIMIDFSEHHDIIYSIFFKRYLKENIDEHVQEIKEKITVISQEHRITFVENRLNEFAYFLLILKYRMKKTIPFQFKHSLEEAKEYRLAKDILSTFGLVEKNEVLYLTAWLLGQTVGNIGETSFDRMLILDIVERIVFRFELLAGIQFDDKFSVLKQLYSHIRPTYYRMLFRLPIINGLIHETKQQYKEMFFIVKETLSSIESVFGSSIPDEEIAFLTMHFSAMIQNHSNITMTHKTTAIVVCPNGIGSSAIIYTELKNIFSDMTFIGPVDYDTYFKLDTNTYDIVFSTIPNYKLLETSKPVFVVNPIMSVDEKYDIIRQVYSEIGNKHFRLPGVETVMNIVEKYATVHNAKALRRDLFKYFSNNQMSFETKHVLRLSDVIKQQYIQLNCPATTIQEAIEYAAQPLLDDGVIEKRYVKHILKHIEERQDAMLISPGISMPHTKPENGSHDVAISFVKLQEPIMFQRQKEPISCLFFLSAIDHKKHIHVMADLVKLLSDTDLFQEKLKQINDCNSFLELLTLNELEKIGYE
ncbi:BglG family transcription antiterminator [Carnobacteriaceae bacterium zg-ZUI78]|nr:BglG family transcription antiterminator [Carnobacteriaceae bacterium zg-ZUI78]